MARSLAWRSLSGKAVKVWIEIRSRFNGFNNGDLRLSMDEGALLLGMSKSTVQRAFMELEEKGFLELTERGFFYGRMATRYSVTDQKLNGQNATRAWQLWRPSRKP